MGEIMNSDEVTLKLHGAHTTNQPTLTLADTRDVIVSAAIDRAVRLWNYAEDQMWTVSVRTNNASYEVHKPVGIRHNGNIHDFEVRRCAT
jgi:hypothetical protein